MMTLDEAKMSKLLAPVQLPRVADDFLAALPAHKASLSLTHNDHLLNYETVEQDDAHREYHWVSDEQRGKAYATNDVWVMQWFPDTPVGSYTVAAADLDVLLDYVKRHADQA